jgi:hypothetical protein
MFPRDLSRLEVGKPREVVPFAPEADGRRAEPDGKGREVVGLGPEVLDNGSEACGLGRDPGVLVVVPVLRSRSTVLLDAESVGTSCEDAACRS